MRLFCFPLKVSFSNKKKLEVYQGIQELFVYKVYEIDQKRKLQKVQPGPCISSNVFLTRLHNTVNVNSVNVMLEPFGEIQKIR